MKHFTTQMTRYLNGVTENATLENGAQKRLLVDMRSSTLSRKSNPRHHTIQISIYEKLSARNFFSD